MAQDDILKRLTPEPGPKSRTEKITKILHRHYDPHDLGSNVADVLADLRHYCDANGLDFAACDRRAYEHYCVEKHQGD